jgi:hypothetical protein
MRKFKSQLTCSFCSKIFKDPIQLPCNHSICCQHLTERDVVKQNKIKCNKCKQDFQVSNNDFKSNTTLKNLIESQSYLSEEETSLKQELEVSIRTFFEFYDEFSQKRNKTESDVFDHFQELRFQIDEHREKLKEKIDEIALKMIDDSKKYETMYLRNIKEKLFQTQSVESLEKELNDIEDTFRNPNLLIQSIKEMQQKQQESLKDIQIKLNQMNQVKDNLEATNELKSNSSFLRQVEDTSLFGSIKLNGYCPGLYSLKGQIINDEQQCLELIKLCEFSQNDKWSLLYRGTRDGFRSSVFHSKRDDHHNTLTIFKAKQSSCIFGGFTTVSWESSTDNKWKSDPNAFLFSLINKDNQPVRMKVDPKKHQYAICCHSSCGPVFGHDIRIANNANTSMDSYSDLGDCYKHPQYAKGTNEAKTFLAGSYQFKLDEIEVYEKE